MAYKVNIEQQVKQNTNYRNVLHTSKHAQLVAMSLQPDEEIPEEVHEHNDQFFRVEQGSALVRINDVDYTVETNEVIIVPGGAKHYVKSIGVDDLKLLTIYAPPEHPEGTVHKTKAEADEYEKKHD
jgi:mannose-6-phosphate isomerase-like protein (cupin superfamily)